MTDETFSTQSATLYTSYYYLQLLLYRPFLKPPSSSVASTSQPSQASSNAQRADISANAQAICINAARRCAHIIQRQMSVANGLCDAANLILISHTSGAFLLRCVWQLKLQHQEARRAGAHAEQVALEKIIQELQQDIDVCIRALEVFSRRWDRAETLLYVVSLLLFVVRSHAKYWLDVSFKDVFLWRKMRCCLSQTSARSNFHR